MFKFIVVVFSIILANVVVNAGIVAPIAYANAPLYAPGGSSQIDIRNNFDGTLSSYTTAPFNYAGPIASRYVSGLPLAAPAALAAPLAAPLATSLSLTTPFAAPYPAQAIATSPLAAPFAAPARLVL